MVFSFFFSSRRRHTRYIGDWSSDVCSSDLRPQTGFVRQLKEEFEGFVGDAVLRIIEVDPHGLGSQALASFGIIREERSEERRVGKECSRRWAREQEKRKEQEERGK